MIQSPIANRRKSDRSKRWRVVGTISPPNLRKNRWVPPRLYLAMPSRHPHSRPWRAHDRRCARTRSEGAPTIRTARDRRHLSRLERRRPRPSRCSEPQTGAGCAEAAPKRTRERRNVSGNQNWRDRLAIVLRSSRRASCAKCKIHHGQGSPHSERRRAGETSQFEKSWPELVRLLLRCLTRQYRGSRAADLGGQTREMPPNPRPARARGKLQPGCCSRRLQHEAMYQYQDEIFCGDREPNCLDVIDASGRKKRFVVRRHSPEVKESKPAPREQALYHKNQEHGPWRQLSKGRIVTDKSVGDNLSFNAAEGVRDRSIKMK